MAPWTSRYFLSSNSVKTISTLLPVCPPSERAVVRLVVNPALGAVSKLPVWCVAGAGSGLVSGIFCWNQVLQHPSSSAGVTQPSSTCPPLCTELVCVKILNQVISCQAKNGHHYSSGLNGSFWKFPEEICYFDRLAGLLSGFEHLNHK